MVMRYYSLIKYPIVTESTNKKMESQNEYVFAVQQYSNKTEIKKAFKYIFNVKVDSVRTINVLPKFKKKGKFQGYTSGYKKAIIKLVPGQRLNIFNEK